MSPLILYNGGLLLVDGKLASHASCCCGGACCIPEGCYAEVTALFVDIDLETNMIVCPSAPPPPPPGYTLFESYCVGGETRVSKFRKTLDPNICENPDPEETGTTETMEEHFIQVSQLPGPPGKFDGGGEVLVYPTGGCQDGLSQNDCETRGGIYHPGKTCADNPCLGDGYCCGWICDYVAEIIWPDIENPEDVPEVDPPEGWILNGPGFWTKVIEGVENCDDPDVYAAIKAELEAELDAVVAPLGGFSVVSLYPDTSGQHCINATEQECADTFSGTWYESQEECWGNCENPFP